MSADLQTHVRLVVCGILLCRTRCVGREGWRVELLQGCSVVSSLCLRRRLLLLIDGWVCEEVNCAECFSHLLSLVGLRGRWKNTPASMSAST